MKTFFSTLTMSLLAVTLLSAQVMEKQAKKYAKTITDEDLTRHLTLLASDSLEGRETGKKGQKIAAEYIKNHFESLGLKAPVDGSYFQKFNLYQTYRGEAEMVVNDKTIKNLDQMVYWANTPVENQEIEIVFVNKATEEDLEGVEAEGKFLAFQAEGQFTPTLKTIEELGAKGALVFAEDSSRMNMVLRYGRYYATHGSLSREKPSKEGLASVVVYNELAEEFFGKPLSELKIGDRASAKLFAEINTEIMETENVLGYLEGTEKPEELIILTAHYDHVGVQDGKVYNGADDDASGTTAVLEIAEAFVKAKKAGHGPKRSVLFMPVTGEEKGLLGSAHYAENPVFPLENTVTNLNIDMIGRVDSAHMDNREFVYLIGSNRISTELHEISEAMNENYTKLELDYTYNAEDHPDRIYYRSDHWNFAKNGVPIIFYFNGTHPDYHQHTDTVDKIEFDVLKKRTDLVFYTAWEIANRENRLTIDEVEEETTE
ncbi:M28 family peptidase [Marivirga harenae]|uniref:M28 family peptidase n=1 Tax=Marivirga harenae TaxID=2010992 RepID=UPI0026E0DB29|nr:M28 family peptidase [Marivirga harenae]WKV13566.1 M28 family peptidase [Marivirga harenae]|tara:strand:+ start:206475 stop:207935 length:1461 start_codon:yes stop_codon:yes gene_type:complete